MFINLTVMCTKVHDYDYYWLYFGLIIRYSDGSILEPLE